VKQAAKIQGRGALHLAFEHGQPLYVFNDQLGWVLVPRESYPRISRTPSESTWIYGADPVSPVEHCSMCTPLPNPARELADYNATLYKDRQANRRARRSRRAS
jgi:hypothetical protein